jgi:serine phosphatase RsbU (regulator of sigma subunit)
MIKLWSKLSHTGIAITMPIETSRKVILTNQLAYISFIIVVLLNSSFWFIDFIEFEPMSIITAPIILSAPLLNRFGHYKISSFSIVTLMPLAALFFSSLSKTLMPTPIPILAYLFPKLFLMSFLVLPFVLIDSRNKLLLTLAILINLSCIFLVEKMNQVMGVGIDIELVSLDNYERINFLILFPIAVILFGFISLNSINNKYETHIISQNRNLEHANAKIEEINENLTDSIEYAKYIQSAILPDKKKFEDFFDDSFVFYKAKSIVSGDFYFIKNVEINGDTCIVLTAVDCTGHGVPGGFMSMLGISMLNEIIQDNNFTNAADILDKLRRNIKVTLNQSGKQSDQRDGMEMALVAYYPSQQRMEFAGARNPLYIISEDNELLVYKANNMPIGIHLIETAFTNTNIELKGGEMCYMFSDGITDQTNPKGTKFTSKRLQKTLIELSNEKCNKQTVLFSTTMKSWMTHDKQKKVEQIDDMLLLGFRINKT